VPERVAADWRLQAKVVGTIHRSYEIVCSAFPKVAEAALAELRLGNVAKRLARCGRVVRVRFVARHSKPHLD